MKWINVIFVSITFLSQSLIKFKILVHCLLESHTFPPKKVKEGVKEKYLIKNGKEYLKRVSPF